MVFGLSEAEFVYRLDFASSYYTDKASGFTRVHGRGSDTSDQYGREFLMKAEPNMPISDLDILARRKICGTAANMVIPARAHQRVLTDRRKSVTLAWLEGRTHPAPCQRIWPPRAIR